MRKIIFAFFLACIFFGGHVTLAHASDCSKETLTDKWGDRIHTILKRGEEKKKILAKRKADRALACAKRKAEKADESLQDSLDCSKETRKEKWGDRIHTILKRGEEKKKILAKRKADRVLACEKRKAEQAAGNLWDSLDCSEENLRDQWPDWVVTLGKSGAEKDKILAEWKADPRLACAKLKAEKAAEEARKSSEKLQKELEL
ncbi:MAG: hypothetical protein V1882_07415 [Candidatus Omnitrophota bacterium]